MVDSWTRTSSHQYYGLHQGTRWDRSSEILNSWMKVAVLGSQSVDRVLQRFRIVGFVKGHDWRDAGHEPQRPTNLLRR